MVSEIHGLSNKFDLVRLQDWLALELARRLDLSWAHAMASCWDLEWLGAAWGMMRAMG